MAEEEKDTQNSQDKPQETSGDDASKETAAKTQPADKTTDTKDTPQDTSSQQPAKPQFSADDLKKEISSDVKESVSEEVSKSVIQRIGKALGLTEEESEEQLPNDPDELKRLVDARVEERIEAEKERQEQEVEQTQEERQQKINTIVRSWHNQYESLARSGKVPKIESPKDENDPGVQARKKLIKKIGDMINENKEQGINYTPTVHDAYLSDPSILEGPPGADLPISGNTQSRQSEADFSNKEVKQKSFKELAREGVRQATQ